MTNYIKTMIQNTDAFTRKDVEALGTHLTDDYASYLVEGGDVVKRTSNKEETLTILGKMFDSMPLRGSKLDHVMAIGDHVVAVEKDKFDTPEGEKTTTTIGVYHFQDGKIWRAYSFPIQEDL